VAQRVGDVCDQSRHREEAGNDYCLHIMSVDQDGEWKAGHSYPRPCTQCQINSYSSFFSNDTAQKARPRKACHLAELTDEMIAI